ncbi:hypothetical protein GALL_493140 [mine drainage metagenome]|uniref:Uncharacterized protein n=1 Tax=mine drainage metagenome TaxID=410659 RepID=A0A1J5PBP8_9ZZZZ
MADIAVGICVGRIERQRPLVVGEGFVEPSQFLQRERTHIQRLEVVGLKFVAQIEASEGLLEPVRSIEEMRELVRRVPMARIELQRMLKAQDRVRRAFDIDQDVAEISP